METDLSSIYQHLHQMYPNLKDIIMSFSKCSLDDDNNRFLVENETKCINFDRLARWISKSNQEEQLSSADSLSITDSFIYLIEFKTGDQLKYKRKKDKLISGVKNKINGSNELIYDKILSGMTDFDAEKALIRFYVVVDTKVMGISAQAAILAGLSRRSEALLDDRIRELYKEVLPEWENMEEIQKSNHFYKIDIWYSEVFDKYIELHGIKDVVL